MANVYDYIDAIYSFEAERTEFEVAKNVSLQNIIKAKRKYGTLTKMYIKYCDLSYKKSMFDEKTNKSYYRKQTDDIAKEPRKKPDVDPILLDITGIALGQLVLCWTAEDKSNLDNANLYKVYHAIVYKESPEAIKQYRSNKDLRLEEQLLSLIKKFWFYLNKIEAHFKKEKARAYLIKIKRIKTSKQYENLVNFIDEIKHQKKG